MVSISPLKAIKHFKLMFIQNIFFSNYFILTTFLHNQQICQNRSQDRKMEAGQKFQYAVVGAGAYGLSIAYYLAKNNYSVALFQKSTIGHANGSSHGSARISRSFYPKKLYTDLHKLALREYWPQIEKELQTKFLFKNQVMSIFGDSQTYQKYRSTTQGDKQFIDMNAEEVKNRYPNFPQTFGNRPVILDTEAAIISAELYCSKIESFLRSNPNVMIFENTDVTEIRQSSKAVLIQIQSEIFSANKIVLACGRWTTALVPEINDLLQPCPQTVAYLKMDDEYAYRVGRFPAFAFISSNSVYYGLPDIKHNGIKFSQHQTKNKAQDPQIAQKRLEKRAKQIFQDKIKGVEYFESCYYTMTKNDEFIIDWTDPEKERVLICSCCSGHGFKFAPLIGKIVSDLLIANKSVELFEANRHTFQIEYHRGVNLQ